MEAVGLTPDDCRHAATLERRRMRDAGFRPGMSPVERRKRIEAVLPPAGEPWAPPGRCTTLWLILAELMEKLTPVPQAAVSAVEHMLGLNLAAVLIASGGIVGFRAKAPWKVHTRRKRSDTCRSDNSKIARKRRI